jgi:hypothetical protein
MQTLSWKDQGVNTILYQDGIRVGYVRRWIDYSNHTTTYHIYREKTQIGSTYTLEKAKKLLETKCLNSL